MPKREKKEVHRHGLAEDITNPWKNGVRVGGVRAALGCPPSLIPEILRHGHALAAADEAEVTKTKSASRGGGGGRGMAPSLMDAWVLSSQSSAALSPQPVLFTRLRITDLFPRLLVRASQRS